MFNRHIRVGDRLSGSNMERITEFENDDYLAIREEMIMDISDNLKKTWVFY